MAKVTSVEEYFGRHPKWEKELNELRKFFLSYKFEETIKWGTPVYMLNSKNLFSLAGFKNHYAIWLFQGGLLEKNTELLVNAQEEKTHAMRQIRFDEATAFDLQELAKYIEETLSLHKQGKRITASQKKVTLAEDLLSKFRDDKNFEKAFKDLTPGKQREYSEHISQAKREETRLSRLDKITPLILAGKGLNDKYK